MTGNINISETPNKSISKYDNGEIRSSLDQCATAMIMTGQILLESGSEVSRVEKLMNVVGDSFEIIDSCASYVTMTGIMVTVSHEALSATKIVRVHAVDNDLAKIRKISSLAYNIDDQSLSPAEVLEQLEKIRQTHQYKPWQIVFFAAVGAAGFAFFFDLAIPEIICVFISGLVVQIIGLYFDRYSINRFLKLLFEAFFAAVFCHVFSKIVPDSHYSTMLLSVLMLLVPGMTLTNSLRDFLSGNYVAGSSRFTEALLVGISLAMGTAIAIALMQGVL